MLHVNFNTYNNYVTDSLYQWDVNQDLVISGLGLSVAPEIHFANANMDRAIVRQSTLEGGVITIRIPNSLLQAPLTIKAYVGLYEGDTFKVIETIEIPVIAKARPADYTIEDSDEEIYSFNKLENEIVNAKMEIAEQCDANLVELTETNARNAKLLNTRLDNIVANNNDTEGNTELIDMRVDHAGNTHESAGEALRDQDKRLFNLTDTVLKSMLRNSSVSNEEYIEFEKEDAYCIDQRGKVVAVNSGDTNYHVTEKIAVIPYETLLVSCAWNGEYSGFIFLDENDTVISRVGGASGIPVSLGSNAGYYILQNYAVVVPKNAAYIRIQGNNLTQKARVTRNFSIYMADKETRKSVSNLFEIFGDGSFLDGESVNLELQENKLISANGLFDTTEQTGIYVASTFTEVNEGELYKISCGSQSGFYAYAFFDNNYKFIDGYRCVVTDNTIGEKTIKRNIIIPFGVKYIMLAGKTTREEIYLKKITSSNYMIDNEARKSVSNLFEIFGDGNFLDGESVNLELQANKLIGSKNFVDTIEQTGIYVASTFTEVNEGELYKISCGSQSGYFAYAFYDNNYKFIDGYKCSSETTINKNMVIPLGVKYIALAGKTTREEIYLKKITSSNIKIITPWNNKKWVAYGDSITESNFRATKNYHDYIREEMGITVLNYGKSGTGYAGSNTPWHTKINELKNIDFDIITFFGSGNDMDSGLAMGTALDTGTGTIGGCINTTLDNLLSFKPLAKIGIITPNPWFGNTPANNGTMETYSNMLVEIARRRSIPVLDLFHCSTLNPNNVEHNKAFYSCERSPDGDGVHPNAAGHARIAPIIREFLRTLL